MSWREFVILLLAMVAAVGFSIALTDNAPYEIENPPMPIELYRPVGLTVGLVFMILAFLLFALWRRSPKDGEEGLRRC